MPKASRPTKREPKIGDKVKRPGSDSIYVVNHVSSDGNEVDILLEDTNLEWFRVPVEKLIWVK
jgi:hypothetical protein